MYQLLNRKTIQVTPQMAEKFLEANNYVGQRPLNQSKLKRLVNAIKDGVFTTGLIAISKQGWNGGDPMMANGQHQCNAIIATNKTVFAYLEEYSTKTLEDFALLYRQFDNHGNRNLTDVSFMETIALGLDWAKDFVTRFLSAIAFMEGWRNSRYDKNDKVEYLKLYVDEGNFIYGLLKERSTTEVRHLRRGVVMAAMITTYQKNHTISKTFWTEVRDGENLKSTSASLKLRNYLLSTACSVGRGVTANNLNDPVSEREMFSKCIIAWNAYRKGDTTALRYYPNKPIPKAL